MATKLYKKQSQYLMGLDEPRPRRFYLLPKVHKKPEEWSRPHKIPPGRPIVSDCGSETYHTAKFIDFFLNPSSVIHPRYIKDTFDFINKIRKVRIPTEAYLFTMDVKNLYTIIDIQDGMQAVTRAMTANPNPRRPDKELTRNYFEFDENYYLQTQGTAMGKIFAPAYANIFMSEWEKVCLERAKHKPTLYYRFLNDIWGILG